MGGQRRASVDSVVDAAFGLAALTGRTAAAAGRQITRAAAPVAEVLLHPPLVPEPLHLGRVTDALAERGQVARSHAGLDLERLIELIVPRVVHEVVENLDLTALVRDHVDLDGLVATVDVGAVLQRVDPADVNALVARVDIDGIVDRLDLDAIAGRIDLDAIAARIDVDAVVRRVDVDAVVKEVDIEAVIGRIDLIGLADEVVAGIDLPEIIRASTGSMASDVVRGARMQSIDADQAVSRLVDRLLLRRRGRRTDAPGEPRSLDVPAEPERRAAVPGLPTDEAGLATDEAGLATDEPAGLPAAEVELPGAVPGVPGPRTDQPPVLSEDHRR